MVLKNYAVAGGLFGSIVKKLGLMKRQLSIDRLCGTVTNW